MRLRIQLEATCNPNPCTCAQLERALPFTSFQTKGKRVTHLRVSSCHSKLRGIPDLRRLPKALTRTRRSSLAHPAPMSWLPSAAQYLADTIILNAPWACPLWAHTAALCARIHSSFKSSWSATSLVQPLLMTYSSPCLAHIMPTVGLAWNTWETKGPIGVYHLALWGPHSRHSRESSMWTK